MKLIDELIERMKGSFDKYLGTTVQEAWEEMLRWDDRLPTQKMVAVKVAARSRIDREALANDTRRMFDQALSEKDLTQFLVILRAGLEDKVDNADKAVRDRMSEVARAMLIEEYQKATGVPYTTPSPPAISLPSPLPIASFAASPSPSPRAPLKKTEVSWLTKMIWKLFPETNTCE
jgi:hypothetical protein